MPIGHVKAADGAERVAEILQRDGCAVVDRLVPRETMARVMAEMAPWLERVEPGRDDFAGRRTRRAGALIARSRSSHELIQHPLVLDAVRRVLGHARTVQLHLTQLISIGAGEPAQTIHRDQWAFDFFPFPRGFEVQCNTMWALDDFTEANGATRVIPGSHRLDDRLRFTEQETEAAEMEAGSVLFYTGSLYHGGGANRSAATRSGLNLTYVVGWLRQEENQYLSAPIEVARELPEPLQRLMGYALGAYALGYVDDVRDPIQVLRPGTTGAGFGAVPRARSGG
jgi:ectoine hydroxylase-related dioxygenase (phytanoyl-CoA dioxygenase family)